jgi:hypothetical protein
MSARGRPALALLLCLGAEAPARSAPRPLPPDLRADPARMEERILKLGTFGANPEGGVSRVAYTAADLAGRAYVTALMKGGRPGGEGRCRRQHPRPAGRA